MPLPDPQMIEDLSLTRLSPDTPAHAAVVSLPVPPGAGEVVVEGVPSQSVPIAWWPQHLAAGEGRGQPRRLLVSMAGGEQLPAEVHPSLSAASSGESAALSTWETRVLEHNNYVGAINWETGELVLRHGDREIGLRPGLLREDGEPMW